ncbi:MAG: helix-turn-helix domain-containing protein [Phycisphaerae bacterium]
MTVRDVARQLQVSPDTVHRWVRSGQLRAADVSARGGQRACWRVDGRHLEDFLGRRANRAPQARRDRSRRPKGDVIEFIK